LDDEKFAADVDPLELLREREAIYLLLPNIMIKKNHTAFTIDPSTRYLASALKGLAPRIDVTSLYGHETDQVIRKEQDVTVTEFTLGHATSLATSNQNSTHDNYCEAAHLSEKFQSDMVLDYKTVCNHSTFAPHHSHAQEVAS